MCDYAIIIQYYVGVSGTAPEPYAPHAQILLLYDTPCIRIVYS